MAASTPDTPPQDDRGDDSADEVDVETNDSVQGDVELYQEPTYIAFMSYKGGVGRSLAATSCANALARGGKRVLLIDFDVEAPSLTAYYEINAFADRGSKSRELRHAPRHRRGVVAWVVDRHESASGDLVPTHPLEDHLHTAYWKQDGGQLRLLPAGPVGPEYLADLAHPRWQGWIRPRETEEPWAAKVADELKEEIRQLGVDFVVLDTPAGIDAVAYRVMLDITQHVVFLITNEVGEPVVAGDAEKEFDAATFHLVHSRYQSQLASSSDALKDPSHWAHGRPPHVLRHDPYFGLKMQASVPLEGGFRQLGSEERSSAPYQLTFDHLALLDYVIGPKELDQAITDTDVREWLHKSRVEGVVEERYKLFTLAAGTIANPSDPEFAPNVSFRQSSIRRMFNDVWRALPENSENNKAFGQAGYNAGEKYGQSLKQLVGSKGDFRKTLERWCREDTQVGFGDLRLDHFNPRTLTGRIVVRNAFLPPEEDETGHEPSRLLRGGSFIFKGYMMGVLHGLFGTTAPPGHGEGSAGPSRIGVRVTWVDEHDLESRTGPTADVEFSPDIEESDRDWE